MRYQLVFSDIDGTLLNAERELSQATIKAVKRIKDQVPVVLISSRMPAAMRHLQKELDIENQPIICYNGGLILIGGKTVHSTCIPLGFIEALAKFNVEKRVHLSLYHEDEWYVPEYDFWAKREESNTKVSPKVFPIETIIERWRNENKSAHKIMCMGEEVEIDRVFDFLKTNYGDAVHLYRSKPTYIEIAHKQISKLTSINYLLENHFQNQLENSLAFGDNYNDLEMLQAVGMGVAVGNAKPEVLKCAHKIADTGKNDGVAKMLDTLFPSEK